jgi:SAM-dependent methyltransferase
VLELGCGKAEKTRSLAETGRVAEILALEVDAIQHARNLQVTDLPNVRFAHGGAEAIPAEDNAFDIVIMLKSLHHVPVAHMDTALSEIARVLKPGGLAWISEPVFAGELNEIMRLFHDEKIVREAAFAAVCRAVEDGRLLLKEERFFNTRSLFDSFRAVRCTHDPRDPQQPCAVARAVPRGSGEVRRPPDAGWRHLPESATGGCAAEAFTRLIAPSYWRTTL